MLSFTYFTFLVSGKIRDLIPKLERFSSLRKTKQAMEE